MNNDVISSGDDPKVQTAPAPATDDLRLDISQDRMEARLSGEVEPGLDQAGILRRIVEIIRGAGVSKGLISDNLRKAVASLEAGEPVKGIVVARGIPAKPGRDASVEVLVDLGGASVGRKREDGHIDFRDRGPLPVVMEGQQLARLTPAVEGEPGWDVTGARIAPPPVETLRLRAGKGVSLERGGRLAAAQHQGLINRRDEDFFEVLKVLEINGDVDYESGHVDFPGLVKISGAVLAGFEVRASMLEVKEMEPGSKAWVEGDISVSGGVMGAEIEAGGDVNALYVRDSKLTCEGDLKVSAEIVGSRVKADGSVWVTSAEGRIVNSEIAAVRGVIAGEIISSGAEPTTIRLGPRKDLLQAAASRRKKIRELKKERSDVTEALLAQTEELEVTEHELRDLLVNLKDPDQQENRDNLRSQLDMIKPLREMLKEGVGSGSDRLEEIDAELYNLQRELLRLEDKVPRGHVWLDVRVSAAPTTEIFTPHSSLVLEREEHRFSAREVDFTDEATGRKRPMVKMSRLRKQANL